MDGNMAISQEQLMALQAAILALHEFHEQNTFHSAVPGVFLTLAPNYNKRNEILFRLMRPHYELEVEHRTTAALILADMRSQGALFSAPYRVSPGACSRMR
jgi:hypothetical protein